jgi:mono/diheme cytochrome c family protein
MMQRLSILLLGALLALPAAAEELGKQVFQNNCAMCHQADAQGTPGLAPPLKGAQWAGLAAVRTYVPGVLLAGMNGQISLDSGNFIGVMPPQNRLSDEEIAAVSNYLVSGINAQADWKPLAASEVAGLRQSTPSVASLRALRKQGLGK